jgi:SAM-dependent methyltransferase
MKNACSVCGDSIHRILIKGAIAFGSRYDVLYCGRCEVGKTFPVPSREDLSGLYASGRYRTKVGLRFHGGIEKFIGLGRLQRRRRIERYIGKGAVLDIGCGRGLFLDTMKRHGWNVMGVEVDREMAERVSRTYDIEVIEEGRMPNVLSEGQFDVVTIYHVLEHLPDPVGMIRECGRVLRKGGMIVIAVPNFHSLQGLFGKSKWLHLDLPFHLHHFSETGLRTLLESHRFTIRAVRRFDWEYNVFGWLQTLLNRTGIRKNALYDFLKSREIGDERSRRGPDGSLFLSFLLLPLFFPVSLVLSLAESYLFGRGGTVEVHAFRS